jgi:hypothetical protein
MTEKRACLHCGDALTKPTQKNFCSRQHFRDFSRAASVAANDGRKCLHCGAQLTRTQKSFCSKEHRLEYIRIKNSVLEYTDMKCRHCGEFIPLATRGRLQNKLFCSGKHRQEYNEARRAEKADGKPPIPRSEPRYCEHPGCENVLPSANRHFCCREHTPLHGMPVKYTEAQADQIRGLFFSGTLGLRETAAKVGVTLGTVVRIVYTKSPGWTLTKKPRKKPGPYKKRRCA